MNNRTKRLLFLLEDGGRKTVSGVPPLIFKSDGSALKNYRFYGSAWGVGDYDENSGKYVIPVTIAGKNKFDGTLFSGYYTDSTMTSIGGVSGNYKSCKVYLSAGTYTFSCSIPVLIIRYITSDIYRSNPIGSKYTQDYTFTLANDSYVSLAFRNESNTAWDDSTTIQVELSQSATEYEPYREPTTTNLYLPEQIKMVGDEAEHIDYREQKMHKVRKNLFPVVATSKTVTGVTFTVNVDKSVTCNGTNRGTSNIIFEFNQSGISLEIGRSYIISGCPEGGAMSGSYAIQCYNGSSWIYEIGHGATFPALGTGIVRPRIIIPVGVTVNNLTFYPMIRKANIEDATYEPYIENTDLDVTLPALPILSGTNTLSVGTTVQPSKVEVMGKIKAVSAQPVLLSRQISDSLMFGSENELDEPHQSAALTASPEGKPSFDVSEQLKGDDEYADDQSRYSSDENDLGDNSENTDDFGSDSEVGRESTGSAGTGQ